MASTSVRIGVSTNVELIRHGVTSLLSQLGLDTGLRVRFANDGWAVDSVDMVMLDLTGYRSPPADHFSATWTHGVPTLGLVVGTDADHHAAAVLGCHRSVAVDAAMVVYLSAVRAIASGRTSPSAQSLTWRELQVVHLIASGFPNLALARLLFVSDNTIKTYVRQAYRKIGVRSRSQAARWAILNGVASSAARGALFGARDLGEARALGPARATT